MHDKHTKDYGIEEHTNPAQGGSKQPHESSDLDKVQPTIGLMLKNIEERQLTIFDLPNVGWIQVKPKKGEKGRTAT